MSEESYQIKYTIQGGPFPKDEIVAEKAGGCDAVIIHNILYLEDGSRAEMMVSARGPDMTPLSAQELFQSWALMAKGLSEDDRLDVTRRELCAVVFDSYRDFLLGSGRSG